MRSRLVLAAAAFVLVILAIVGSVFGSKIYASIFFTSQKLRVATGPANDDTEIFLTALQREVASERARLQLSVFETPTVWASARSLNEQRADVAMVRSDDPLAAEGRTIFILKTLHFALLVPAQASFDSMPKLKSKKIGVLSDGVGTDPMAKAVLAFYGFDEKQIVRLRSGELAAALRHKQVAAVAVVGPTGAGPISDAVEAFRKATKRLPKFVDLPEAEAIARQFAVYDKAEISSGAFGGAPTLPSNDVTTISTNVLLVSRASLSNHAAGELTRLLLTTKTKLAATWSKAGQLAAPKTDKDVLLPAHPGTIAFLNGEQPDLLDKSTNLILLASMLTGFVGWLATGLNTLRKGHELERRSVKVADAAGTSECVRSRAAIEITLPRVRAVRPHALPESCRCDGHRHRSPRTASLARRSSRRWQANNPTG